jgi:hypothetical protein
MHERASIQHSGAMKQLLEALNADFRDEASLPGFLLEDKSQGPRLQNTLRRVLAPILLTDPEQHREQRKATITALLRHAEQRERPTEELDHLRTKLKQIGREGTEQLAQERERGLRDLASMLSEWAASVQLSPAWQVDEMPNRTDGRRSANEYRIGARSLRITQWHPLSEGPWASTMMCLAACLVNGELNRLRCCSECWKYIFARDFRQTCCKACYKKRDGKRAAGRMKRFRRKRQRALKDRFISTLPALEASPAEKVVPKWNDQRQRDGNP